MLKAHQIKLYPTKSQEAFFRQSCGTARFAYNWALQRWEEMYKAGGKPSAYTLIKELTAIKREQFPWMVDVGKCAPQYAIHDLGAAFKSFFKKTAKHPRFKKKGKKDSFIAIENKEAFGQRDGRLKIPRLGWVRCAENLRFENAKVNNVTIKRIAGMWFAVVNCEIPDEAPTTCENQAIVGVDLGVKSMAVCSNGVVFDAPKALQKNLRTLKSRQRSLARKQKGSNNRKKQQVRVARLHYRITNIRSNAIHQATRMIVNSAGVIVLEDLNVAGMLKNHTLAQAIGDASFSEFRRQIEYKARWAGKQVVYADRFFPSSKTCSCCGDVKKELKLSVRTFTCESCGFSIDRDLNAAINLAKYGSTPKSGGSKACGAGSSLVAIPDSPAAKQEVNIFLTSNKIYNLGKTLF